jgi:hypothetical protein
VELENPESVDQKRAAVRRLLAELASTLRRQGSVQQSWRTYRGRRLGPFYRLAYREGGRQCSVYLGSDEELVNEVRQTLQVLQSPLRHDRQLERQLTLVKAALKDQKQALDGELRQQGLYRKGAEIRGWRSRPRKPPRQVPAPAATPGSDPRSTGSGGAASTDLPGAGSLPRS